MGDDRILVQVPAQELPLRAQALLDSGIPRPAGSRFLARRTHLSWIPAAWLGGLLLVGFASVRATITAGLDPAAGAERLIYGALAAVSLVGAVFAAGKLLQGLAERRDVRRGHYRRGLHVLGRDGLLIAGSDRHTWVPREKLPPATDVTDQTGGGTAPPAFAYFIVDDAGRMDRLDCGGMTQSALWMWAEHGQLPEGGGWV
ncbi:MAG: hypothetical protein RL134_992 [Actinomycetota bacterium]|jgi:hypothetical protein